MKNILSIILPFFVMCSPTFSSQPPKKIPAGFSSVSEKETADLMTHAVSGNTRALRQLKRLLRLAPPYQKKGVGAPYFSSPHLASKQIVLWTIIGAFLGDENCLKELQLFHDFGSIIDFRTGGQLTQPKKVTDYMSFFILTEEEEGYYDRLLRQHPEALYALYFLYMNARAKKTEHIDDYLIKLQGRIDQRLLFGDIFIDRSTGKVKIFAKQ